MHGAAVLSAGILCIEQLAVCVRSRSMRLWRMERYAGADTKSSVAWALLVVCIVSCAEQLVCLNGYTSNS
jgi:hypothetical protein